MSDFEQVAMLSKYTCAGMNFCPLAYFVQRKVDGQDDGFGGVYVGISISMRKRGQRQLPVRSRVAQVQGFWGVSFSHVFDYICVHLLACASLFPCTSQFALKGGFHSCSMFCMKTRIFR